MSKQLKLKFKKLLKKADFIHADLEYHEELVGEAKQLFHKAAQEWLAKLPAEEREKLREISMTQQEPAQEPPTNEEEESRLDAGEFNDCMSLVEIEKGLEEEEEIPSGPQNTDKEKELKRLFYRIAGKSHPDKAVARGATKEEIKRLECLFRKAARAHKSGNWYGLYSIAADLGLDVGPATGDHVEWVEEDIRQALGAIARVAHLIVWVWYTGDDITKDSALRSYFLQVYGYDYPRD